MSEEILRAMMELFALIVKQDSGMLQNERDYVWAFLTKQLTRKGADEFMSLFLENAGPLPQKNGRPSSATTSVRDAVRIFNNCKTINKTLTQEQRIIVLLHCFELVDSAKQYTLQRMNIINTIAEVFRVSQAEFNNIMLFVRAEKPEDFNDPSMLVMSPPEQSGEAAPGQPFLVFLKVASVNLYFMRCFCDGSAMLNGLPVICRKVYTFAPGSSVQAPPWPTVYYSDIISRFTAEKDIHRISFAASHLNYVFPDGSPAITDLSFSANEGMFIGIMGASGTGKTTLLNLLSGLYRPKSGDVRINGISIFSPGENLDGVIGNVPQDDLLIGDLTVFENLYYAASLCFAGKKRTELNDTVMRMLRTLGLAEKKDHRVGTPLNKVISGGQRKRLNIALELIREPSVLFLDEPTSGLSSSDSENVMDLLHELTLKGKLVITVVHQPSSEIFKGFDKILVLDLEGQMVYYGNPIESVIHFKTLATQINSEVGECPACGNVNPETLFNILETRVVDEYGRYTDERKVTPAEWAEAFRRAKPENAPAEVTETPYSTLNRPGWWKQMFIFLSRDLKSKLADRQYLLLTVLEGPILGLILSYIIRYIADPSSEIYIFRENENIPIYIFMSIIVALFLGLTISAEEIFRDRKMLKREHFMHLNRGSYLISKITVLIVISSLQTFLFLVIADSVLEIKGLFPEYWLALFTTAFCANMIGLNISSALNSAITIYIVIPLLMIPMMVLSGAMFPFDKLNRKIGSVDKVPVIAELMPTRWTYEALMVKQFKGNEYDRRVYQLKQQISVSDFNTIYRIPRIREATNAVMAGIKRDGMVSKDNIHLIRLIRNEINTIYSSGEISRFSGQDSINPDLFTASLGERLLSWLYAADSEFKRRSNTADISLDNYVGNNKEVLHGLYNEYHNDRLEEIVRKVYEKNKMLEYKDRLIQNADLIYLNPSPSNRFEFRTHFMAPVKAFLGLRVDTFTFNIVLVLFSTVLLYLLLYFEVLRKAILFFGSLKPQKK